MCVACNGGLLAFSRMNTRRDFLARGASAAAALAAWSAFPAVAPAQEVAAAGPADVVFRGGAILTINEAAPCAEALAVRGGRLLAVGSLDFNVTPIGPLRCVQRAATRIMKDGGEVFVPEQRIPVEAALRAVTIDAAWQCRMDDIAGSLKPRKYADLTILEQIPIEVGPTDIEKIKVSETWLAGERRHAA